jgi:hypothetical protein
MKLLFETLTAAVADVDAKRTALDNAQKNLDGAAAAYDKAVATASEAYAAADDAVKTKVPSIAPGKGRAL